jgi:thiol-disulfide isomerase/thioredoxin
MALFKKRPKPTALESLEQLDELTASGKPVFVDFFQHNCMPCRTMDGIVNELAQDFDGSAHVVKINAANVPMAFQKFKVKSTPTFMILTANAEGTAVTQRWRASGLVKKDVLVKSLVSSGAKLVSDAD